MKLFLDWGSGNNKANENRAHPGVRIYQEDEVGTDRRGWVDQANPIARSPRRRSSQTNEASACGGGQQIGQTERRLLEGSQRFSGKTKSLAYFTLKAFLKRGRISQ